MNQMSSTRETIMHCARYLMPCLLLLTPTATSGEELSTARSPSEWISLFNGKDLSGWTVKITGHPLGKNFADTFRVEEGILKVSYDDYKQFDKQYGHLYTNIPYAKYRLRMEYRFTGKMMPDAPKYVNLNSGLMIHSQSPQSLELDQHFPVSLEFQFLADEGNGKRATGNVCTPGTNLEIDGKLITQHIVKSSAPTFPAHEWVAIEIEVQGNEYVIHRVNGQEVLRYERPQIDPAGRVESADKLLQAGALTQLSFGFIALQAEGQPVWFRNIELQPLE
jgi:hypothetical protein|tara:strand:+ start:390 stop:1223 length:834 start_codon:yes stop_codon:yes gene_type:complete